MVVYTKILVSGTELLDVNNCDVDKSLGDNNSASSFEISLDNFYGYNKSKYELGNEIIVYADVDVNPPTTKIFTGILEDVSFDGQGLDETMILSGRDYTARLMDRTVEPEVYSNLPAGSIIRDIMTKYTNDIDYSLVGAGSGDTIERISFNHTPVFDAVKKLTEQSNYLFYVDVDKKLHFEPKSTTSSGYTLDNSNVLISYFKEQRDTLYNKIWVYGDRYLDGYKETFKAGSPLGGSVFTLLYKPSNTEITFNGSIIQPGAIEGITATPGSDVKYLVNYDDKRITFTSGTTQGNNVPASGTTVVINYKRGLPIVKVGDNELSKSQYGERVKVIVDKDIKDPATAEKLLKSELEQNANPKIEGNLAIKGIVNITPGQTCIVNLPNNNVINQTYDALECNYRFNKSNNLNDSVLRVKVNEKLPDITDTMKNILNDLRKLQGGDISNADTLTRFQYTTGSFSIEKTFDRVQLKSIGGQTLIWGSDQYGIWGTGLWGNTTQISFILGNPIAAILGTSTLGISSGATTLQDYYVNWYGNFNETFTGSKFISTLSGCSLNGGSLVF